MSVRTQIDDYIAAQPERKPADLQALHASVLKLMPDCRLWFLDGKDESGRTVSNPNIGYGVFTAHSACTSGSASKMSRHIEPTRLLVRAICEQS